MIGRSIRALREGLSAKLAIGFGGLLALGVTTAQSVIGALPPASLPALSAGQPLDAGRWRITVHEAISTARPQPTGLALPDGGRAVAIEIDLENLTSASNNVVGRIFSVDPPVPGLEAVPAVVLMRDGELFGALHPGLPERVRFAWRLAKGAAVPGTIRLTLSGETYKARDNLLGTPGWFGNRPLAAIELRVRPEEERS